MTLRTLRAILVTGAMWAGIWAPLGALFGLYLHLQRPYSDVILDGERARMPVIPIMAQNALGWSIWGAVIGLLFSIGVVVAERRRTLAQLSVWRFAILGALAALALPAMVLAHAVAHEGGSLGWPAIRIMAIAAMAGSLTAAAMLRFAQRGSPPGAA